MSTVAKNGGNHREQRMPWNPSRKIVMKIKASAWWKSSRAFSPLLTRTKFISCKKIVILDNWIHTQFPPFFITVVNDILKFGGLKNTKILKFRKCLCSTFVHNTEEKWWKRCVDPTAQNHLFLQMFPPFFLGVVNKRGAQTFPKMGNFTVF